MKPIRHLTLFLCAVALTACSALNGPSAGNQSGAQFLDEVWIAPEFRGKPASEHFIKVYFAPATTANLSRQGWWTSQSSITQRQLEADAGKLARHFDRALADAARNNPDRKLTVVGQPGPDTLIVEVAITELVPAKAYWNATATAAGFVVPGAGLLSAAGSGSIAIEGRLRDGNTGKVAATFRDRMKDKMAMVNVSSYTWYGGSEANLEETATNIARVLNAKPGTVVNQSGPVTLVAF